MPRPLPSNCKRNAQNFKVHPRTASTTNDERRLFRSEQQKIRPVKRSILFVLFLLSGLLIDGVWTWYSYHFEASCADSGNSVPPTWFLFTGLMLIPAGTSLIFRSNRGYFFACFTIWLFYAGLQLSLIGEEASSEKMIGINCYRDVGAATTVSFAFTIFFVIIIAAIALAFGATYLFRMLRRAN